MKTLVYEPPALEVKLTLGLGLTLLSPYYRGFARSLGLRGDEHVLDFGCGAGVCARHMAAQLRDGGRLECVDVSHGWQTVIRKNLRRFDIVGFHLGHLRDVDLADSSCDVAVIHFVLHEIPAGERPEIMRRLAGKLKPGGRLVVREPQNRGLSQVALERMCKAAGLKTLRLGPQKLAIWRVYDGCFVRE